MPVKKLTLPIALGCVALVSACNREPEVYTYTEIVKNPPRESRAMPGMESDHAGQPMPAGPMRAGPLTVEPVPENLPEGHPPLDAAGMPDPGGMRGREGEVPPAAGAEGIVWTVPDGWEERPASGMRAAVFAPDGAEGAVATLIVLPLNSGSLQSNVDRWRRQVGLPPGDGSTIGTREGALTFTWVDLLEEARAAGSSQATLAAVYETGGRRLFLKFMGPVDEVAAHADGFLELARSLMVEGGTP